MKTGFSAFLIALTTLWVVNTNSCWAQEDPKLSPAARQAAKARGYANRDDATSPTEVNQAPAASPETQEGSNRSGSGDADLNKAQKDVSETFKNMEKAFDSFK